MKERKRFYFSTRDLLLMAAAVAEIDVLANLAEVLHRVTLLQSVPGYRDAERSDWTAIEDLAEFVGATGIVLSADWRGLI